GPHPRHRREARRVGPVAQPLLGRVQRVLRRVPRPVGYRDHLVVQGRRRPADPRALHARLSTMAKPGIPEQSTLAGQASDVEHSTGPSGARWTHIALPSADIEKSIEWYTRFTPLELLDQREDADGQSAWLGHSDQPDNP